MDPTIYMDMPRKNPSPSDFGQHLATLRRARGLTQAQLAETTGASQRSISYYENHAENPPAWMIARLSKALAVTADELLGLTRPPRPAVPTDDPEVRRAWNKFQQLLALPEKDQRAVIRLVNSLVSAHGSE